MITEDAGVIAGTVSAQQLSELRHVLDRYDDLPPDRFGDPLTLALLVEEFALAARTILEPAASSPSHTSRLDDGAERLSLSEPNAADPADAANKTTPERQVMKATAGREPRHPTADGRSNSP